MFDGAAKVDQKVHNEFTSGRIFYPKNGNNIEMWGRNKDWPNIYMSGQVKVAHIYVFYIISVFGLTFLPKVDSVWTFLVDPFIVIILFEAGKIKTY